MALEIDETDTFVNAFKTKLIESLSLLLEEYVNSIVVEVCLSWNLNKGIQFQISVGLNFVSVAFWSFLIGWYCLNIVKENKVLFDT